MRYSIPEIEKQWEWTDTVLIPLAVWPLSEAHRLPQTEVIWLLVSGDRMDTLQYAPKFPKLPLLNRNPENKYCTVLNKCVEHIK